MSIALHGGLLRSLGSTHFVQITIQSQPVAGAIWNKKQTQVGLVENVPKQQKSYQPLHWSQSAMKVGETKSHKTVQHIMVFSNIIWFD